MSVLEHQWIKTQSGHTLLSLRINAERSLNALNLEMIQIMRPLLQDAATKDECVAVIIDSAGEKAFCAGGDVVSLQKAIKANDIDFCETYFEQEYRLDYELHTFPKPVITWGSGIVMGGGMGLLTSSSFPIVTETSLMAMPEITIALYPDVGASWFLNRLQGDMGLFLGLTGARLNAKDAQFLGLSPYLLNSSQHTSLISELRSAPWGKEGSDTVVRKVLMQLAQQADDALFKPGQLEANWHEIQALMHQPDRLSLFNALSTYDGESEFIKRCSSTFNAGSPLTAHVVVEQLNRTRYLSLKEIFELELALSVQCCAIGEFGEGVRALLIDKDGQPHWRDKDHSAVTADHVNALLASPFSSNPLSDLN